MTYYIMTLVHKMGVVDMPFFTAIRAIHKFENYLPRHNWSPFYEHLRKYSDDLVVCKRRSA